MCDISCRKAGQCYRILKNTRYGILFHFTCKDSVSYVSEKEKSSGGLKGSPRWFLLSNSSVVSRSVILYSHKESDVFYPLIDGRSVMISPVTLKWKMGRCH